MDSSRSFILFLVVAFLPYSLSTQETNENDENASTKPDFCQNPETQSQRRLLDIIHSCTTSSEDCSGLEDCLSENLVRIANEAMVNCKNSQSNDDSDSGPSGFRPCSVAATAYVLLEQIRRLLVEDTVYKDCEQVKGLFRRILKQCGGEDGEKLVDAYSSPKNENDKSSMTNDLIVQDILAKFLVNIGKRMQTYDIVKEDIAELERSKHMKALGAMILSFALPGLLGLCEAAHFRTGLILQILALFVIGIYQFTRYGGYWASLGVGSCLLVLVVEIALLILIRKKFYPENEEETKKSE